MKSIPDCDFAERRIPVSLQFLLLQNLISAEGKLRKSASKLYKIMSKESPDSRAFHVTFIPISEII